MFQPSIGRCPAAILCHVIITDMTDAAVNSIQSTRNARHVIGRLGVTKVPGLHEGPHRLLSACASCPSACPYRPRYTG